MSKVPKDALLTAVRDAIEELGPEVIIPAMARDEEAFSKALEDVGFTRQESRVLDPNDVLDARTEAIAGGRVDNGFGAGLRKRASYVRERDPVTQSIRRNYLHGELDELASQWFRSMLLSSNGQDPKSGKWRRQIAEEMESHVRAPSDPFSAETGEAAGVSVPTQIAAQIYEELNEMFVVKGMVEVFTSATPLSINRRTAKVTVTRGGRSTDLTESHPELGSTLLTPQRVGVITYVDALSAAASAHGLVRYCIRQVAEAIAEDDQRVIVAGTGQDGEPKGIAELPTSGANAWDMAQTATYDNTSLATERNSMKEALYAVGQGHRRRDSFIWLANSDGVRELTTHNDEGQRPWDEANETYLRKRVIETSALSTASNITQILGGDMSQYAWIESPMGLRLEQTNVGGEAWEADMIGLRAVQYVDGAPIIPPAFVQVSSVDV